MKRIHTLRGLCWSLAIAALLMAAAAAAAAAAPALRVTASIPDYAPAGRGIAVTVGVLNTGDAPLNGDLTVRYTLPAGVTPTFVFQFRGGVPAPNCQFVGQVDECVLDATGVPPGGQLRYRMAASVDPSASGVLTGAIEVSGGGTTDDVTVPWSTVVGPLDVFAVKSFDIGMTGGPRQASTQAGSAPAVLTTHLAFQSQAQVNLDFPNPNAFVTAPPESLRDAVVHVPPGFVGNPLATPVRCSPSELTTPLPGTQIPACPLASQIGVVQIAGGDIVPLYNIQPPHGSPAEFGFFYQSIVVTLLAKLRPTDDGIDIVTQKTPSSIPIPQFEVTMWGVPGDPSHNPLRGGACLQGYLGNNGTNCPLDTPRRVPFLRLPTSCTDNPLTWGLDVDTYQRPDTLVPAQTTTPRVEGCQFVPFDPSFTLAPTVRTPHAPTGLDTTLTIPQDNGADGVAEADVQTATVTLPDGMTINPSSADGLQACTDDQLNLARDGAAACPLPSKVGTVTLDTPLLDHQIGGSVFLRTQNSDDPTSGEMFRIAIEIRSDDDGVDIKLPGSIVVNPDNGTLTTTFDNLPQLPFGTMQLHFKDGPRAPLVTPSTCGAQTTNVVLHSWSDAFANPRPDFSISGDGNGGPCPAPKFSPAFAAGVENPVVGKSSPLHVTLDRGDDDQQFRTLTVNTPTGLLGKIKSVQQCSEAAANLGTCSSASQIGTAKVGAGVGPNPFFVTDGKVFLTGPYKGAPYGLAVVVHAKAGPFDLGIVVVRAAIHIDRRTSALSVTSEPFPQIVKGVVLNVRSVRLSIDRPGFMVNPTSCQRKEVGATVTSTGGLSANVSSRFQLGNCGNLRFSPKLSMTVGGPGLTGIAHSTPLSTTLTQPAGQSNLREVKVTLPTTLDALLPVVNRACTLAQYDAGNCRRAEAGSAVAVTPLLKDPLKGAAFFVKHPGRPLPDLMVALRGDVDLDLVGKVSIPGGTRLATDFTVPDAPVTRFTLNLVAGHNGPVGVVTNLCTRKARNATVAISMKGQNGASINRHQRLHIRGCGAAKRRHR
jgi:hypothetical protein